jgi:hypothetical protein
VFTERGHIASIQLWQPRKRFGDELKRVEFKRDELKRDELKPGSEKKRSPSLFLRFGLRPSAEKKRSPSLFPSPVLRPQKKTRLEKFGQDCIALFDDSGVARLNRSPV